MFLPLPSRYALTSLDPLSSLGFKRITPPYWNDWIITMIRYLYFMGRSWITSDDSDVPIRYGRVCQPVASVTLKLEA